MNSCNSIHNLFLIRKESVELVLRYHDDSEPGFFFTNVSRALQNNLAKIHNVGNPIFGENFKLKLCTCAQSQTLGTRTKFQLKVLIRSTIFAKHKFQGRIFESSRNVSETTPRNPFHWVYSITIKIWFKFVSLQVYSWLWYCHNVSHMPWQQMLISAFVFRWTQDQILITFELWWKNC